jgi:hypothetical protein
VNEAEVREGRQRIELVLVAEDEALVLTSTAAIYSSLFLYRDSEPPLYIGHYHHSHIHIE